MRTTKVIAFSVPPEFESQIQEHARLEHRTVSEYIREAVRQYMGLTRFNTTQRRVMKKSRQKKLKRSAVDEAISDTRKRSV